MLYFFFILYTCYKSKIKLTEFSKLLLLFILLFHLDPTTQTMLIEWTRSNPESTEIVAMGYILNLRLTQENVSKCNVRNFYLLYSIQGF